jgi:hypothetical protein
VNKKTDIFLAVNVGYKYNEKGNNFIYNIKLDFARKIVFNKWKKGLEEN